MEAAKDMEEIKPLPELWKRPSFIDITAWQKPAPPPKRTDLLETGLLERLGLGLKRREPIVRRV